MQTVNDITTVKDIMDASDDVTVIVKGAFSRDLDYPSRRVLYQGSIKAIPEELQTLEVLQTGHSVASGYAVITVWMGR